MKKDGIWKKKNFYIKKNFYKHILLFYKIYIEKFIIYKKEVLTNEECNAW